MCKCHKYSNKKTEQGRQLGSSWIMGQACVTLRSDATATDYACAAQHWRCGKSVSEMCYKVTYTLDLKVLIG